jgi:hypothetical protein
VIHRLLLAWHSQLIKARLITPPLAKGGANMRRILVLLSVVALVVVMLALAVGPAFATQGLAPNPGGGYGSSNSNNCAAYYTAVWIHNGSVVRYQDRQTEVKTQQAFCNNANQK